MDREKRQYRKLKRELKRAGGKSLRQKLKRDLAENPEEAPFSENDFGRKSTESMNGIDQDSTRRRGKQDEAATSRDPEEQEA